MFFFSHPEAHKVIRCKGDLREVAKNMVLDAPFTSQATAHGQRYEPEARAKFEETRNLKVHQLGLVVMPQDPWLGCSPDGLFRYLPNWPFYSLRLLQRQAADPWS